MISKIFEKEIADYTVFSLKRIIQLAEHEKSLQIQKSFHLNHQTLKANDAE